MIAESYAICKCGLNVFVCAFCDYDDDDNAEKASTLDFSKSKIQ